MIISAPIHYQGTARPGAPQAQAPQAQLETAFNSSAVYSFISPSAAQQLGGAIPLDKPKIIQQRGGSLFLEITHCVPVTFRLQDTVIQDELLVVAEATHPVVIGANTLLKYHVILDGERNQLVLH